MTLAEFRRTIARAEGRTVTVTNHYATKPDHPCFGAQQRTVLRSNTVGFYLSIKGRDDESLVHWPKASQLDTDGETVRIYGGGVAQDPEDLFLTIELPEGVRVTR